MNKNIEKEKINFHFTDHCNFSCKCCFVKKEGRELSLEKCKKSILEIKDTGKYKRINLAGGEPLTCSYIQEIIDFVVSSKLQCSIITNGSLLNKEFIRNNKDKLCMIGISIDALDQSLNNQIGRQQVKNIDVLCEEIRANGIYLKINICVSKLNLDVDFSQFFIKTKPDRIKFLQMLPSLDIRKIKKWEITEEEFNTFCNNYGQFPTERENSEFLKSSYDIIDSEGILTTNNLHNN